MHIKAAGKALLSPKNNIEDFSKNILLFSAPVPVIINRVPYQIHFRHIEIVLLLAPGVHLPAAGRFPKEGRVIWPLLFAAPNRQYAH